MISMSEHGFSCNTVEIVSCSHDYNMFVNQQNEHNFHYNLCVCVCARVFCFGRTGHFRSQQVGPWCFINSESCAMHHAHIVDQWPIRLQTKVLKTIIGNVQRIICYDCFVLKHQICIPNWNTDVRTPCVMSIRIIHHRIRIYIFGRKRKGASFQFDYSKTMQLVFCAEFHIYLFILNLMANHNLHDNAMWKHWLFAASLRSCHAHAISCRVGNIALHRSKRNAERRKNAHRE